MTFDETKHRKMIGVGSGNPGANKRCGGVGGQRSRIYAGMGAGKKCRKCAVYVESSSMVGIQGKGREAFRPRAR